MIIHWTALLLPVLLVSCSRPADREAGSVEIWVNDFRSPAYTSTLDPAFAHALHERRGERTSAGFLVLEDDLVDEEIGRTVFTIAGVEYTYPIMKCTVPEDGTVRFAWHGPQNDLRTQHWSRDAFFVDLSIRIQRKSANITFHGTQ